MQTIFDMPASEPGQQHALGRTMTCEHCGAEKYLRPCELRTPWRFCSLECRRAHHRKLGVTVECAACGRERYYRPAEIGKTASRYCSKVCKDATEAVFITCHHCGEVKRRPPSQAAVKTGRYGDGFCSLTCWHAHNKGERAVRWTAEIVPCAACSAPVKKHKSRVTVNGYVTCSRACDYKMRKGRPTALRQPREPVKCPCGRMFEPRPGRGHHQPRAQKYCSRACANDSMRISTDYVYGPDWPRQRRRALKRDNRTCQHCGNTDKVEVHHLNPKRRDGTNYLSNLLTLCRPCHKTADAILAAEDRALDRQLVLIPRPRTGRRLHSARRKEAVTA